MGAEIEQLAAFVAEATWDDIPDAVKQRAKLTLLDTLGVILAGTTFSNMFRASVCCGWK